MAYRDRSVMLAAVRKEAADPANDACPSRKKHAGVLQLYGRKLQHFSNRIRTWLLQLLQRSVVKREV